MVPLLVAIGLNGSVLVLLALMLARNVVRVPPDAAAILTGRKRFVIDPATGVQKAVGYRIILGGSAFRIPVFERVDYLSLNEMAIEVDADDLRDEAGRAISVALLVNCRISGEPTKLERAISRFLTMALPDIEAIVKTTILSRLSNTLLAIDLSESGAWPTVEAELNSAIRNDLAGLGIDVDTLIFGRFPTPAFESMPANGRGSARSE